MEQQVENNTGWKAMRRIRILTVALAMLSFSIGGCIYLLWRSTTLLMFGWLKAIGLYDMVLRLRPDDKVDSWLVCSLPDGLWLFASILLMGVLWRFEPRRSCMYSAPLVIIAIGSELLQIHHIVSGTFDIVDLVCYVMATVLGVAYIKFINYFLKHF